MGAQYVPVDEMRYVERACAGDAAAFETFVRRYERPLYGFVYHLMGDADDAADLLQETFIKVYRALPRTPADVNFSAWLYRVARNCCLDELRRRRARWPVRGVERIAAARITDEMDPEEIVLRREGADAVAAVLARMSGRSRAALILREVEGMSCEEIGAVLGVSRQAAKSILFRAREEFRRVTLGASDQ